MCIADGGTGRYRETGQDARRLAPAGVSETFLLPSWVEDGRLEGRVVVALESFPKSSLPHTAEYRLESPCWTVAYLGSNVGLAATLSETYRYRMEGLLAEVLATAVADGIV